jgi:hypothetical protein
MKAENYQKEKREVEGKMINITTYKIGERYFCHIDNVSPGATIARTEGATLEEARELALQKVTVRLQIY